MPVYLSIFGILNLVGKLATCDPSKSFHVIPSFEALICLNLYSSLSMWAWVSSEVVVDSDKRWNIRFVYQILLHGWFISFQSRGIQCHHSKYGFLEFVIDQGFVYHILLYSRFITFHSRGIHCHYLEVLSKLAFRATFISSTFRATQLPELSFDW